MLVSVKKSVIIMGTSTSILVVIWAETGEVKKEKSKQKLHEKGETEKKNLVLSYK